MLTTADDNSIVKTKTLNKLTEIYNRRLWWLAVTISYKVAAASNSLLLLIGVGSQHFCLIVPHDSLILSCLH